MKDLEKGYANVIHDYPNLISADLRRTPQGRLGQTCVCLRQETLHDGISRIDLAFVTEGTIFLVELKRDAVNNDTFKQLRKYKTKLVKMYPKHEIRGYLIGMWCPEETRLRTMMEMNLSRSYSLRIIFLIAGK